MSYNVILIPYLKGVQSYQYKINAMKKDISELSFSKPALLSDSVSYCLLIWGAGSRLSLLEKKTILRIVSASSYVTHAEPIFGNLNLLKIEEIYKLKMFLFSTMFYFNQRQSTLEILYISSKHFFDCQKVHSFYSSFFSLCKTAYIGLLEQ